MKKVILSMLMAVTALGASAQVEEGFRQGITANLGVTNVCYEGDGATLGYGLGWVAEYNFTPQLYFQSGVTLQNIDHTEQGIDGTLRAQARGSASVFFVGLPGG